MNDEKIVHNANQIAAYFAAYPRDEALQGIAEHFNRFWEYRLRAALLELLRAGECNFHPLVIEAAALVQLPPILPGGDGEAFPLDARASSADARDRPPSS